jgi:hypothetical protein
MECSHAYNFISVLRSTVSNTVYRVWIVFELRLLGSFE